MVLFWFRPSCSGPEPTPHHHGEDKIFVRRRWLTNKNTNHPAEQETPERDNRHKDLQGSTVRGSPPNSTGLSYYEAWGFVGTGYTAWQRLKIYGLWHFLENIRKNIYYDQTAASLLISLQGPGFELFDVEGNRIAN